MPLTHLPIEVLWTIASYLSRQSDIYALAKTNHHLYNELNNFLYYFNAQYKNGAVLSYAAEHNNFFQVRNLLDGLHAARISLPLDEAEEENKAVIGRPYGHSDHTDPYWADIYTHLLYQQGYDIPSIVNIQNALVGRHSWWTCQYREIPARP